MPWKECDRMTLRHELVALARRPDADKSELARRFGVSRKTLYKWLHRTAGAATPDPAAVGPRTPDPLALDPLVLADRSRRPMSSPARTVDDIEQRVLSLRGEHPAWGGRKIRAVLLRSFAARMVPSASTVTRILHRHGLIGEAASDAATPCRRFEHEHPNDLWQIDFKGDFPLTAGGRCHPLTMLDDHSRYNLLLRACVNQQLQTVWDCLTEAFGRYGLPVRMLMDNGSPWGVGHSPACYTRLEVRLMNLDIAVTHGRPYHPQTQGKEERFHRTLNVELLQGRQLADHDHAQRLFDPWRRTYNHERPHEALGLHTPASRYSPSRRRFPATPPEPAYHDHDQVRRLNRVGQLSFGGRTYKLSEAFAGRRIALRPTGHDGVWTASFGRFRVAILDTREGLTTMVRN
jgi:transposase InsO family protein